MDLADPASTLSVLRKSGDKVHGSEINKWWIISEDWYRELGQSNFAGVEQFEWKLVKVFNHLKWSLNGYPKLVHHPPFTLRQGNHVDPLPGKHDHRKETRTPYYNQVKTAGYPESSLQIKPEADKKYPGAACYRDGTQHEGYTSLVPEQTQ